MPELPRHLRIFLASPGDVCDEREIALEVLAGLPYKPHLRGKVTVEAVAWDNPGTGLDAALAPQEAIARNLPEPSECDAVIVIHWSRIGTPLPRSIQKPGGSPSLSGTEWEFWDALRAAERDGKPEVRLYRRSGAPDVKLDDPDLEDKQAQLSLVKEFFEGLRDPDGAYDHSVNDYDTPEDFRAKVSRRLNEIIAGLLDPADREPMVPRDDAALRPLPEALKLLHDAVCGDGAPVELPPQTIREIACNEPRNEREWRLGRIAEWSCRATP